MQNIIKTQSNGRKLCQFKNHLKFCFPMDGGNAKPLSFFLCSIFNSKKRYLRKCMQSYDSMTFFLLTSITYPIYYFWAIPWLITVTQFITSTTENSLSSFSLYHFLFIFSPIIKPLINYKRRRGPPLSILWWSHLFSVYFSFFIHGS